ncbi:DJ-1/PfpI family protein [Pseudovibrio sp. Tun.PSC04-5.I4]|uniref:DJ-1/PfpI family protein n=1 Tax=Pseudovibrio sp. Tun.PSC04-5.I4 TaxID=1798213 RepID=UPI00089169D6|nr:DJ-1/PfpI family protein [Pseudovibrio sp. Tun.PSC04-5.I4]SDR21234.1 DJ-1/PfpI family protein [Pseudovibrio sp. Tun.PSC04-5.I4]
MTKLAVILTQGFADWEYALVAGTGGPFFGFDVQFFAPHAGEVRSQGGLAAVVSNRLEEIAKFEPAVIVVVGGTIWETDEAPDIAELLKAQHANGGAVAGICGGTLALARAGLLNETAHTSNNAEFLTQNAKGYSGAEQYRDSAAAVSSDRIITAPGIAPVSFTAAIFENAGLNTEALQQFKSMLAAEHI